MNKRIKELAKDHFCRTEYDSGNVHECYEFSEKELEKFAELIIKECIETALSERVDEDLITDEYSLLFKKLYLRGNNDGIIDAVRAMRKHFGVEE